MCLEASVPFRPFCAVHDSLVSSGPRALELENCRKAPGPPSQDGLAMLDVSLSRSWFVLAPRVCQWWIFQSFNRFLKDIMGLVAFQPPFLESIGPTLGQWVHGFGQCPRRFRTLRQLWSAWRWKIALAWRSSRLLFRFCVSANGAWVVFPWIPFEIT